MDVQVSSSGDTPLSYLTNLLSTLHSMRQTSSHPDCYLTSYDGTPTPVHLALLSLAWPSVKHLLPHSDGHCSCQCCVQVIAVTADPETVQMVLQLLYTGRTDMVGVVEEEKIKELLQVLGLEWDLEKVESVQEVNNNCKEAVMSLSGEHMSPGKQKIGNPKETLEEGMVLSLDKSKEIVNKSINDCLINRTSESVSVIRTRSKSKESVNSRAFWDRNPTKLDESEALGARKIVKIRSRAIPKKKYDKFTRVNNKVFSDPPVARKETEEKERIATSKKVKESVAAVPKTMIAPGTVMTREQNCVRFFCSFCELEITKFSKEEKESHWTVVHLSTELSMFTNGLVCRICSRKVDSKAELIKHVGVDHKKVYHFLSVLPPTTVGTAQKTNTSNIIPPSNYNSRVVPMRSVNKLSVPFVVKCTLKGSQPTTQPISKHHLTTAYLDEKTGVSKTVSSKTVSSMFPVIQQKWYYTNSSSNTSSVPVLTSLVSHYSSLLGEEDSEKCFYCPYKRDQHSSVSLHQSAHNLEVTEGRFCCGVCTQHVFGDEQEFQSHLATHVLAHMDGLGIGQDLRSGRRCGGGNEFHLFFTSSTNEVNCELGSNDPSDDIIKVSVNVEEKENVEENMNNRRLTDASFLETTCRLCGLEFTSKFNWKRHLSRVHLKEELKKLNPGSTCHVCGKVWLNNARAADHLGTAHPLVFELYARSIDQMKIRKTECEANKIKIRVENLEEKLQENQCVKKELRVKQKVKVKIQSFTCKICNTVHGYFYRHKRHLATTHFKEKISQENTSELKCDICSREFKQRNELIIHLGCFHKRSSVFYKEYLDSSERVEDKTEIANEAMPEEAVSEVDISSVVDEIDLDSSTGQLESHKILSYFAKP
eukprot:GFUD01040838.1.p1 GENE.GFUD01040838.1~~GFUD01040838.1.p1  ORF type:complete len:875 (-),score=188.54 GFUD01040838.1:88-2712(-)